MRKLGITVSIALLIAVIAAALFLLSPSVTTSLEIRKFLSKVDAATITEYATYHFDSEQLSEPLAVKDISKSQIAILANAFASIGLLDSGKSCDFIPHHKITCHMNDGTTRELLICFLCGDLCDSTGKITDIGIWKSSLRKVFSEFGIPVRDHSYRTDWQPQNTEQDAAANP